MIRRPIHRTDPGDTRGFFKLAGILSGVALCHFFIRDGEPFRWHSRIFVTVLLIVVVYAIYHLLFERDPAWRRKQWDPPLRPALGAIDLVKDGLGLILILGFLSNLFLLARVWPFDQRHIELPMVDTNVSAHPDGTLICYSAVHGRVQEYTAEGQFIEGWYLNPGKRANMVLTEDGIVSIRGLQGQPIFRVTDPSGVPSWRTNPTTDSVEQTHRYTKQFDTGAAQGWVISRWQFPCGQVIRVHKDGSATVLVDAPWYLCLWAFPAYPFLLIIPRFGIDLLIQALYGSRFR